MDGRPIFGNPRLLCRELGLTGSYHGHPGTSPPGKMQTGRSSSFAGAPQSLPPCPKGLASLRGRCPRRGRIRFPHVAPCAYAEKRRCTSIVDLIRHGFAVPPSPKRSKSFRATWEGFWLSPSPQHIRICTRLNHHASSRATMNETEGDDSRGRKQYNRGTAKVDN